MPMFRAWLIYLFLSMTAQGYGQRSDTLQTAGRDASAIDGGSASSIRDSITVKVEHESLLMLAHDSERLIAGTNLWHFEFKR